MPQVTIERDGKTYSGTYIVHSPMVTLDSEYGSQTTKIGESTAEAVARTLLSECVTRWLSRQNK